MSLLNRFVDGAYVAWLSSAIGCCAPPRRDDSERAPVRGVERPMTILHHQPHLIPPPVPEPQYQPAAARAWAARTKSVSNRVSFSVKRHVNAYNGLGRPRIGAPTDFRHVQNGFSRQVDNFRPLELSIYMPENRLSPLLPHFDSLDGESLISYPPAALTHTRSESALSNFTIQRKPLGSHGSTVRELEIARQPIASNRMSKPLPNRPESVSTVDLMAALQEDLPTSPPHALMRASTEPLRILHRRDSEQIDRVKSVLHEKIILEKQLKEIDGIIEERRGIYTSSRPADIYEEADELTPDLEGSVPQPTTRPSTASSRPTVHIPLRSKSFSEASAIFTSPITPSSTQSVAVTGLRPSHGYAHDIPPPPLPLVLQASRPTLRKRKSFSRVSNWLFPNASDHKRDISLDSVTNMPKPVTSRDGFYQCIDMKGAGRVSTASFGTVSVYDSEMEELTPPPTLTWSPGSSPREESIRLERTATSATFGEQSAAREWSCELVGDHLVDLEAGYRASKVGVAF